MSGGRISLTKKKQDTDYDLNVNQNPKNKFWVVEDFYSNPMSVRDYALSRDYIQGGLGRGFIGSRSANQYLFPGLKEKFESIMGIKIREWESHGMNGRFQFCIGGEPLVYHCDDQTWAAVLFLTPNAPVASGTSFFKHKITQCRHKFDPRIMEIFSSGTTMDRTPHEMVDSVGNVFNRIVIFDAGLIHSATDYFGKDINNGRLFQIFFFD